MSGLRKFAGLSLSLLLASSLTAMPGGKLVEPKAAKVAAKPLVVGGEIPETLVLEARSAIQRGVNFLTDSQSKDGSWFGSPAMTGLVCMALHNSHTTELASIRGEAVEKGREFILNYVQKDGSICKEGEYANYTTAICLSALAIIGNTKDEPVMRAARRFLIGSQLTEGNKEHPTKKDSPFYGGIGYGSGGPSRPDLSNTQWALEALYLTEYLDDEGNAENKADAKKADLAWKNALIFLRNVQNLPESEDGTWILDDKKDGGFIYRPDQSKASAKFEDKESLRSYGSMTYAGLKSMIYAKLKKDDRRVKAAMDWAAENYTLGENPGMGPEGHYYYLTTFAKAHAAYGGDTVKTADGKVRNWRVDLIKELLKLQKGKGEWFNEKSGRWRESIPQLTTAYALIALEVALGEQLVEKK